MRSIIRLSLGWTLLLCAAAPNPLEHRVSSADRELAETFWKTTVPEATKGGAPKANSATLLFVHIPKTAGSSMERVLEHVGGTPFRPFLPLPFPLPDLPRFA